MTEFWLTLYILRKGSAVCVSEVCEAVPHLLHVFCGVGQQSGSGSGLQQRALTEAHTGGQERVCHCAAVFRQIPHAQPHVPTLTEHMQAEQAHYSRSQWAEPLLDQDKQWEEVKIGPYAFHDAEILS